MIVRFRVLKRISQGRKAKAWQRKTGVLSDSSILFSMTSISGEKNHGQKNHYDSVWLVVFECGSL